MAIITIDGYRGSGTTEVGTRVARALNADYFDRLLLRKAAERAQAPIGEFEVGQVGITSLRWESNKSFSGSLSVGSNSTPEIPST